jgi:hypothetical protein
MPREGDFGGRRTLRLLAKQLSAAGVNEKTPGEVSPGVPCVRLPRPAHRTAPTDRPQLRPRIRRRAPRVSAARGSAGARPHPLRARVAGERADDGAPPGRRMEPRAAVRVDPGPARLQRRGHGQNRGTRGPDRRGHGRPTPGEARDATWRSPRDEIIDPVDTLVLQGADNHLTGCVSHLGLLRDATIYRAVRDFVARRTSRLVHASSTSLSGSWRSR